VGDEVVVGVEREGAGAALAVACCAVPLDDPRDSAVVGDVAGGRDGLRCVEDAAGRFGCRDGRFLSSADSRERVGEKEYMGGQYTLDPAFASAPKPFVEFAKAKWQRLIVDGAEVP
jgi:hypothetical protein